MDALRTSGRTVQINSRLQLDFIPQIRRAPAENARMAKLYREQVLGEKPVEGLVSLDSIAPAKPTNQQMGEPVAGD